MFTKVDSVHICEHYVRDCVQDEKGIVEKDVLSASGFVLFKELIEAGAGEAGYAAGVRYAVAGKRHQVAKIDPFSCGFVLGPGRRRGCVVRGELRRGCCGRWANGRLGLQDAEMLGQVPGEEGVMVDGVDKGMLKNLK